MIGALVGEGGDPLIRIDVIEGRSEAEIKTLLDATHRAVVAAFKVPERDRYQILQEHPRSHMIIEDTGLDIPRTDKVVVVQAVSRPRTRRRRKRSTGCSPRSLRRLAVSHPPTWWSPSWRTRTRTGRFGFGRAQFLEGDL